MERVTPEAFWELFKNEFTKWWTTDTVEKVAAFNDDARWTCKMIPFLVDLGSNKFPDKYHVETEAYQHIDVGYFSGNPRVTVTFFLDNFSST
jgi:hypothetical protein